MLIFLDFETQSACDLRKTGVHIYAAHPTTTPICMAWAIDDGPTQLWVLGQDPPREVFDAIDAGATVVAHNASFELALWNICCVKKLGWPPLPVEQTLCTMVEAYAMGLPGALENVAKALGLQDEKDMAGNRIMLQIAKPRRVLDDGTPIFWDPLDTKPIGKNSDSPAQKYQKVYDYCIQDIAVQRKVYARLPRLMPAERATWILDQKINNRGVYIDTPMVEKAIRLVNLEASRLKKEIQKVTGGSVSTPNAHAALREWLEIQMGEELPSIAKADVVDLLARDDLPPVCREALLIRQQAAKSSTAKLTRMISGAGEDSRVRGCFQYHGAGTGRWAGRRIQFQNMKRPLISQKEIEDVLEILGGVA